MNKALILTVVGLICLQLFLGLDTSSTASPLTSLQALQQRAQAWFVSPDKKSRRKQMRGMTRALKRPCKYCHTSGFKGYTDRHEVSLQMMAISAEHNIECGDCHLGKTKLSPIGLTSQKMFKLAKQLNVECTECHLEKTRFKTLTPTGIQYKDEREHQRLTSHPQDAGVKAQKP